MRPERYSWRRRFATTLRAFSADQCADAAASLTYRGLLAVFPALIAIFSLLSIFGQRSAVVGVVLSVIDAIAPPQTAAALRGPIEHLASASGGGWAFIIGILVALWSSSGYVGAFTRTMNRIHDVQETRPFWKRRPAQLLVTVFTVVAVTIVAIALVLSGPFADALGRVLGLGQTVTLVWNVAKWPVLLFFVVLLIAVLYYATPDLPRRRFRWITLGAVLAIVVLVLGSVVFAVYVSHFGDYDNTYGSLGGIIVFLLWLWIANCALLLGAEFDAVPDGARQRPTATTTTTTTM